MHKNDKMTPLERAAAISEGKPIDRYPVFPFVGALCPKAAGMTLREARQSAKAMTEAKIVAYERFGFDSVSVEYGLYGLGRALGSVLNDPEDSVPALQETVLSNLDDLDKLDLSKATPEKDDNLKMIIEAVDILKERVGGECGLGVCIPGACTSAAGIYKIEGMMRAMYKEPEKLHKLMRLCTNVLKDLASLFVGLGLGISLADPVASGTLLRASHYREFVKPYAAELIDHIHSLSQTVFYHICGQTIHIVGDMVDTGADVLSLDNKTDMLKTRELVGDRICIAGNVDPIDIIMLGSKQEVWEAVRWGYQNMYDSPKGYTLASGCDIPGATPLENVDAFMDAARYYGSWPIDPEKLARPVAA